MDNTYTKIIEQTTHNYSDSYYGDIGDSDGACEFVLDSANFRDFKEGLIELLKRTGYSGNLDSSKEMAEYLLSRLRSINSTIEEETVHSWFNGKHYPKLQSDSRKRMYEICFALNLSVEDTTWFFEHVYYDRCFNCHTITEAVYYYCFLHQLSYDTAQQLIEKINTAPETVQKDSFALHTRFIRNQIDEFQSTEELTSYLIENRDSFSHWNVTALEQIHNYYRELIGPDETKPIVDSFKKMLSQSLKTGATYGEIKSLCDSIKYDIDKCGFIIQSLYQDCFNSYDSSLSAVEKVSEILCNKNTFKMAFVASQLLSTQLGLAKKENIPYIIRNNFPSKKVFSDVLDDNKAGTSQSYDAIRKTYILLKFFNFWYRIKLELPGTEDYDADDLPDIFCEEIDEQLEELGYPPLFAGNPHDWLYLCSAHSITPLEFFTELIGVIYESDIE